MNTNTFLRIYQTYSLEKISALSKQSLAIILSKWGMKWFANNSNWTKGQRDQGTGPRDGSLIRRPLIRLFAFLSVGNKFKLNKLPNLFGCLNKKAYFCRVKRLSINLINNNKNEKVSAKACRDSNGCKSPHGLSKWWIIG